MTLTQINRAGLDADALDRVFTIGASGSSAYTFQGEGLNGTVNNPTLYLTRGKTYRFENGSGGHPIRIQSTSGASGTAYNTGVTNNAGSGTVIVEVQHDAPDVLYYQCTSHAAMNGILYITGALADGGVTTAKIAADAVTTAKIADDAVTGDKIANNLDIPDNNKIRFGTGNALEIYHDGSQSVIKDNGTGQLLISGENNITLTNANATQVLARFTTSGANELYYANSKTFETTANGVEVSAGRLDVGSVQLSGGGLALADNDKVIAGSGDDLQIYHDATDTYIANATNDLYINNIGTNSDDIHIQANDDIFIKVASNERAINCYDNGAVELYFNDGKKLETTLYGVNTYGQNSISNNLKTSDGTTRGSVYADNSNRIGFLDSGGDWVLQHENDSHTDFIIAVTKKLRIDSDGVKFNSDTAAANALDDYEEGTWTVNTDVGAPNSTHSASYTKIGRSVTVSAYITCPTSSSGSNFRILSLPFTSLGSANYGIGAAYTQVHSTDNVFVQINPGNNDLYVYKRVGNSVTFADLSGAYLLFTCTYFTG